MIDTRLIFVDGLPGSGKSTLADWLGEQIRREGRKCNVYQELCDAHPLRIYDPNYTDFTAGTQSAEFRSRQLQLYREYVQREVAGDTISVFDSWLFQAVIGFTFLLRMDYSDSTDFAFQVMETIAPLRPTVIFLGQTDVEANWRRICRIRGPAWTEGRCGIRNDSDYVKAGILWTTNQAYCLSILKRSDVRNLVIMNEHYDYQGQEVSVSNFLQLVPK